MAGLEGQPVKILVTGASGFVGAHVVRCLLERGHSVTCLAVPNDSIWRLSDVLSRVEIVWGRIEDMDIIENALQRTQPEACIHLAWYVEHGMYLNSLENVLCLKSSLSFFHELIKHGCQRIVMAGTCAEYDADFGFLREDTPTRPATLYAAAKLSCCLVGKRMAELAGVIFSSGRIFYPYGPQEDTRRIVPSAISALRQGLAFSAHQGALVRDYIFIEDVAEAFCLLAEREKAGIFNISSGFPITISQLLGCIGDLLNGGDLIMYDPVHTGAWEPAFICGDNHRLRELGWQPRYSLKEGIMKTIDWWKSIEKED